jgi:hypothetical protein
MILVDNGSTQRPANVSGANLPVPIACHLGAKVTRGGGTTADMILSQATNGNTEYEIYDIGNNAISAGYLLARSGPSGSLPGVQMAADRINKSGGINGRPIELTVADDESKPDVGRRKAEKLVVEDKIDVQVGRPRGHHQADRGARGALAESISTA